MLKFRRFLVQYFLGGESVSLLVDSVADLREALAVPTALGVRWSFRSVG